MKKLLTIVVVIALAAAVGYAVKELYGNIYTQSTIENVKLIEKHINSAGKMIDYNGKIGVKGIEDIKLYVKEKEIKIKSGKITLTWSPEDFLKEEWTDHLERIGITRVWNEDTGVLRVYYKGEEMERWAS